MQIIFYSISFFNRSLLMKSCHNAFLLGSILSNYFVPCTFILIRLYCSQDIWCSILSDCPLRFHNRFYFFQDICISAVKERDIEAKLKQVIADWNIQDFAFATFKQKGELLLKVARFYAFMSALDLQLFASMSVCCLKLLHCWYTYFCATMLCA